MDTQHSVSFRVQLQLSRLSPPNHNSCLPNVITLCCIFRQNDGKAAQPHRRCPRGQRITSTGFLWFHAAPPSHLNNLFSSDNARQRKKTKKKPLNYRQRPQGKEEESFSFSFFFDPIKSQPVSPSAGGEQGVHFQCLPFGGRLTSSTEGKGAPLAMHSGSRALTNAGRQQ